MVEDHFQSLIDCAASQDNAGMDLLLASRPHFANVHMYPGKQSGERHARKAS